MISRLLAASALSAALAFANGAAAATSPSPRPAPAPACYTQTEYTAEQLIRLHTEMMTVGLYCKEMKPADDLYGTYRRFTKDHYAEILAAEKTLINFYARNGGKSLFDTFRTELANKASRRLTVINPGTYCNEFSDRVKDTAKLTSEQLKTLTSDEARGGLVYLSSRPLCNVQVVSFPDPEPTAAVPASSRSSAKKNGTKTKVAAASGKAGKGEKAGKTAKSSSLRKKN